MEKLYKLLMFIGYVHRDLPGTRRAFMDSCRKDMNHSMVDKRAALV